MTYRNAIAMICAVFAIAALQACLEFSPEELKNSEILRFDKMTAEEKDGCHFIFVNAVDPLWIAGYPGYFKKILKANGFSHFHMHSDFNLGGIGRKSIVAEIKKIQEERVRQGKPRAQIYLAGFSIGGHVVKEAIWEAKRQGIKIDGIWLNDASKASDGTFNQDAKSNLIPDNVSWAVATMQPRELGGRSIQAVDVKATRIYNIMLKKGIDHIEMGLTNDNQNNDRQRYVFKNTHRVFHWLILEDFKADPESCKRVHEQEGYSEIKDSLDAVKGSGR